MNRAATAGRSPKVKATRRTEMRRKTARESTLGSNRTGVVEGDELSRNVMCLARDLGWYCTRMEMEMRFALSVPCVAPLE